MRSLSVQNLLTKSSNSLIKNLTNKALIATTILASGAISEPILTNNYINATNYFIRNHNITLSSANYYFDAIARNGETTNPITINTYKGYTSGLNIDNLSNNANDRFRVIGQYTTDDLSDPNNNYALINYNDLNSYLDIGDSNTQLAQITGLPQIDLVLEGSTQDTSQNPVYIRNNSFEASFAAVDSNGNQIIDDSTNSPSNAHGAVSFPANSVLTVGRNLLLTPNRELYDPSLSNQNKSFFSKDVIVVNINNNFIGTSILAGIGGAKYTSATVDMALYISQVTDLM